MDFYIDYIKCVNWIERKSYLKSYFASLDPKHNIVSSLGIPLKYSGYFAMIPSNFDVDAHLVQYPITDYMFVKDNTGHIWSVSKNGGLGSSLYFDKDRLIYIIGLISSIPASNKDSITEDGFVSINSKVLRNAFKDYFPYLDYLILTGVFCTDGRYIQGRKSKGYKFTERYAAEQLVRYDYPAFQSGATVEAIQQEVYSEEHKAFIKNGLPDYAYLSHWYLTKKLSIDMRAATSYAHSIMQEKFNQGRLSWDINKDKIRGNNIVRKNPLTQYQAALYNLNSIDIGSYKVSIDTNVHRLHSVITNLQKRYRRFLNYNGIQLVNVDISNSQPYLLCLLLNPLFWDKHSDLSLNIGMLHQNIKDKFSDAHLNEIKDYVSALDYNSPNSTLNGYIQTASVGHIYEYMMRQINNDQGTNLERNDIKVMILTTLFSKNRYMPKDKKAFRLSFPEIYGLIELVKKDNHSALACLLQNIESLIILHRCCSKIWEEGNQEVPVFTIHDSICTTVGNEDFVKYIMVRELTSAIGITPHVKIENMEEQ